MTTGPSRARRQLAFGVLLLLVPLVGLGERTAGAAQPLYASAAGQGRDCAPAAPCSLQAALDEATSGQTIQVLPGTVSRVRLQDESGHLKNADSNVVLAPVSPAETTLDGVQVFASHVTLSGFEATGDGVFLRPSATYSRIDSLNYDNGGRSTTAGLPAVTLGGSHQALVNSVIRGTTDADLVFLGTTAEPVTNILVQGNALGPAAVGPAGGHVDCLQLGTAASHVAIVGNLMRGCSNSSIIIKADRGDISDVLIANNMMQGCLQRSSSCAGYYAAYVRLNRQTEYTLKDVQLLHNTVDGALDLDEVPGLVVDSNIISSFSKGQDKCGPWFTNNLVADTGCRRTLAAGNQRGTATFVDRDAGDLRLRPGSLGETTDGGTVPASDISGYVRTRPVSAGAWESDRATLSVTAPSQVSAGSTVALAGHLLGVGPNSRGMVVQVAGRVAGGALRPISTVPLSSDGSFRLPTAAWLTTRYVLTLAAEHAHAQPATALVRVTPHLACSAARGSRTRAIILCTMPSAESCSAAVQRQGGDGIWRRTGVATSRVERGQRVWRAAVPRGNAPVFYRMSVCGNGRLAAVAGPAVRVS